MFVTDGCGRRLRGGPTPAASRASTWRPHPNRPKTVPAPSKPAAVAREHANARRRIRRSADQRSIPPRRRSFRVRSARVVNMADVDPRMSAPGPVAAARVRFPSAGPAVAATPFLRQERPAQQQRPLFVKRVLIWTSQLPASRLCVPLRCLRSPSAGRTARHRSWLRARRNPVRSRSAARGLRPLGVGSRTRFAVATRRWESTASR